MTITNLPGNLPVADITEEITHEELCAAREVLLRTRKENSPAAVVVRLRRTPDEAARMAIYELLQYVDLCCIDRTSAEYLGVEEEASLADAPAALAAKLRKRFALGGIILKGEHYARLYTAAAEKIYPAVSAWAECKQFL